MKFCIVGTGRCGSRLLREMLNSHPDLFVFNETHWIPKLYEFFGTSSGEIGLMLDVVQRTHHVTGAATTELDSQDFLTQCKPPSHITVAEFCDALGAYQANQQRKSLWADKTPDYGFFATQLQTYWPDCKIIHLIRDGVAVANSMYHHIGYKALVAARQLTWCPLSLDYQGDPNGYPAQSIHPFVELWYRRLIRTKDEATRLQPGTYLEVRHEDVLRSPVSELARIAKFVDLRIEDDWLSGLHSQIDEGRTTKPRPVEILQYFTADQKRLLIDLGYSEKSQ